jgi:LuxR family transcriptional regulator, maltose regulon positive regulatory protein
MIELLRTKLFIPRPRKNLVSRQRLVDCLNTGLDKKLTLIAAPAGFGKTTLLSEWIPQSPRCVIWLSLDDGDNDPVKFWTYVITSLQALRSDLGSGALALLQLSQAPPITSILTMLINDMTSFQETVALVLDDYHIIETQTIHDGVTFLIEHMPSNMHLILTTRADPSLPLGRLRARDELNELRANDLRFSADETTTFLNQVMGFNLSSTEAAVLEARTEGWIAGLQIAAFSMQGRKNISEFIQAFSGSHRHILGYLAEEVLNQQPKGTLNFLLQTSILDRLCASLCNAVTDDSNGQAILENMEHANLFISPLDENGVWYRYHHLFAEVLRARLHQSRPEIIRNLHRRASNWYEQNGGLAESVDHALAAQDFEEASRLIEQTSRTMWQRGDVTTLQNWLAALPPDIRSASPGLCLAQAWGALTTGQLTLAESSLLEAQKAMNLLDEAEVLPLRAEVDVIRSALAGYRQESAKAIELAHRSLEHLPEADHFLRGRLAYNLGWAYLSQGDLHAAKEKLNEAATFSLNVGDLSTASFALAALGAELEMQGRLRDAASCYRRVIQAIQKDGRPLPIPAASGAYVRLSGILYEWNRLDECTQSANQGIELSRPFQANGALFVAYLVLARVLKMHDDPAGANDSLRNAETAVHSGGIPIELLRMVEAVRTQLWLAQGKLAEASQWAAAYEVDLNLPTNGDWQGVRQLHSVFDFECLTLVRVRIAQGQWAEALKLLTRLESVVEAGKREGSKIKLLCLRALALQAQAQSSESITALEGALALAEPEGYICTFVNEGEPMRLLLLDYKTRIKRQMVKNISSESNRFLVYTDQLLAEFPSTSPADKLKHESIPEPLSERELDVLHLIAAGRTNQEIADILVIAVSTVKSHINSLYGKLGTNRRTEAIAIARELGLLSE